MSALTDGMTSTTAKIDIATPRHFNTGAVLALTAFGIFRFLLILIAILVVSVLKISLATVLIPALALAASVIFLPFGFGNAYVSSLVRKMNPDAGQGPNSFIVQLTLAPRLRSGVRAVLEDADDVGVLIFNGGELEFRGDSIQLNLPLNQISRVRPQNIGWRGLYVYGRRIELIAPGLPNVESLEFAERSSWLLPTSRRITKQLYQKLSNK
jgi:hypothetical protein